jgi:hypothetical protein
MRRSHVRLGVSAVAGAFALLPGAAFADETLADPGTVRPGQTTLVVVGCTTDVGSAKASSPLFGDVVLSQVIEPGYYRASVPVPTTARAGTYPITGTCGTTTSTGRIVVSPSGGAPAGDGATVGPDHGPTLIGAALLLGGVALAALATRRRSSRPTPA